MIALSLGLTLALGAQDPKKDAPKPADAKPAQAKPADAKPAETKPAEKKDAATADPNAKPAPAPVVEETPKPIPPEVEAKLEAARRAVAEAIVAAQDAGLVDTSIEPPPILDILVTGRATDKKALKAQKGVSPEVFGAWFTGYAPPLEGITAQGDVRIVQPSQGLKDLYDARAGVLSRHLDAVRKAKAAAAPKPAETKPAEAKPAEKKAETKPAETKPAESKPAAKPADTPKDQPKPAEAKKDEKK
jgi:outer membrane biosynthesis protein TonB